MKSGAALIAIKEIKMKSKVMSVLLCSMFAAAMIPVGMAFAGNSDDSPYYYNIQANGGRFINDVRAKNDDSYVYVKPTTLYYEVTPHGYYQGNYNQCGSHKLWADGQKDYLIYNWIYESENPHYPYASLWLWNYYGSVQRAEGLWSPDSINVPGVEYTYI